MSGIGSVPQALHAARSSDRRVDAVLTSAPQAYLAVQDTRGPHVTPVIYAPSGARAWFLIGRGTRKARVLRRTPRAGLTISAGSDSVVMQGEVRMIDPLFPLGRGAGPAEVLGAPLAAKAYVSRNLAEVLGYAIDAFAMLDGRSFPGDVLLAAFRPSAVALLEANQLEGSWGDWQERAGPSSSTGPTGNARTSSRLDLRSFEGIPPEVAALPDTATEAVAGWLTPGGPLSIPIGWDASSWHISAPGALLRLGGAPARSPASLVFDLATSSRPTGKRGLLIRGRGTATGGGVYRRLTLHPDRVTFWTGPRSGSVNIASPTRRKVA